LRIIQQWRDKLTTMPEIDSPTIGPAFDAYLPGLTGLDWTIEFSRFREFALDEGWKIPENFPQGHANTLVGNGGVTKPAPEAIVRPPSYPKNWRQADEARLKRVIDCGLDIEVLARLESGEKKAVIAGWLIAQMGEDVPDLPAKSPWARVIQALTPSALAAKERSRGGSGRV
jgi:hypothetical protein